MFLPVIGVIIVATAAQISSLANDETTSTTEFSFRPPTLFAGRCEAPKDIANGRFILQHPLHVEPGQTFDDMKLDVLCDPGYGIKNGRTSYSCFLGNWLWFDNEPVCERFCELQQDDTIEYRCPLKVYGPKCYRYCGEKFIIKEVPCPIPEGADKGYTICKPYVSDGTVVQPVCLGSNVTLPSMTCVRGVWNKIPYLQQPACLTTNVVVKSVLTEISKRLFVVPEVVKHLVNP